MRWHHWLFILALILLGASTSNFIKKYLTFLPNF